MLLCVLLYKRGVILLNVEGIVELKFLSKTMCITFAFIYLHE